MEVAAPYFLLDQPFRIRFKFRRHTFNLAPSEPQLKLGLLAVERFR
jgi:hypothetical protein